MGEDKRIEFVDENGNLKPLDDVIDQIKEIYGAVEEEIAREEEELTLEDCCNIDPSKILVNFSFQNRCLYICEEIKHEDAIQIVDAINFWNALDEDLPAEEREPIKIYIDTPGGDLDATFSIIDVIRLSKTPVWTITIGKGYSGGFFIGISGHKRIGYPHSSYLFHEGSCCNEGDAHKYIQFTDFYKKKLGLLKELVLKYTSISEAEYEEYKKDDLWLTATNAIKYNVIDEIATELI